MIGRKRRREREGGGKRALLDIGCAIGTFLLVARESGWNVRGVEVSKFASEYARKNYNLNVMTGELESQNLVPNSFNVITLWDTVDHIERPQEFLQHIFMLLKSGGILAVETTMEDSLLYRTAHYMYVLSGGIIRFPVARCHPFHHSTFYTTKTLRMALERAGFKIVKQEASDLSSKLINTNIIMRMILKIFSIVSLQLGGSLETVFYVQK